MRRKTIIRLALALSLAPLLQSANCAPMFERIFFNGLVNPVLIGLAEQVTLDLP